MIGYVAPSSLFHQIDQQEEAKLFRASSHQSSAIAASLSLTLSQALVGPSHHRPPRLHRPLGPPRPPWLQPQHNLRQSPQILL
ncbi:hypothetical protein Syun_009531 [Stephania yunnanensis]|uniref:Uncharacterized protein n=1 Tax=Stephania yunnanensis TaxID=152371 RepID=A0AAP0PP45_9MAGN